MKMDPVFNGTTPMTDRDEQHNAFAIHLSGTRCWYEPDAWRESARCAVRSQSAACPARCLTDRGEDMMKV